MCDHCLINAASLLIAMCLRACEAAVVSVTSLVLSWGDGVGAEGG